MNVELRGTIRAALGTPDLQVDVPAGGVPLSRLLEAIAAADPRARAYVVRAGGGGMLRPVHNGTVVAPGDDPVVRPEDSLMLLHAVAGG